MKDNGAINEQMELAIAQKTEKIKNKPDSAFRGRGIMVLIQRAVFPMVELLNTDPNQEKELTQEEQEKRNSLEEIYQWIDKELEKTNKQRKEQDTNNQTLQSRKELKEGDEEEIAEDDDIRLYNEEPQLADQNTISQKEFKEREEEEIDEDNDLLESEEEPNKEKEEEDNNITEEGRSTDTNQHRIIMRLTNTRGESFILIVVYGPPDIPTNNNRFWTHLSKEMQIYKREPILLLGNTNAVLNEKLDKKGGTKGNQKKQFGIAIAENNIKNIWREWNKDERKYTYR